VLLPGIYDSPRKFHDNHFIADARSKGLSVDFVAVDSHIGYFEEHTVVERLHTDIILPAKKAGYKTIWLAGISLGGFGALLYAARYAGEIDGIVLLSPYLGSEKLIDDIKQSGGLNSWKMEHRQLPEEMMWAWAKDRLSSHSTSPALYLGYGKRDKYKNTLRLLRGIIDADHIFTTSGGHNWKTWRTLWQNVLRRNILTDY